MKAMTPIGPMVGKMMGQPPNLRELISSADNVTFWAKHEKAVAQLGYSPRGIEQGMRRHARGGRPLPRPRPPDPAPWPDARHRRRAPRAPARDRLLGGRRRPGRPRPGVLAGDAAGGARRRAAAGGASSPTSTSTTRPRPARSCGAGPRSRSTSTSAARPTWSTPRGCWPAPSASTVTRWSASGGRSSRCPRRTCGRWRAVRPCSACGSPTRPATPPTTSATSTRRAAPPSSATSPRC